MRAERGLQGGHYMRTQRPPQSRFGSRFCGDVQTYNRCAKPPGQAIRATAKVEIQQTLTVEGAALSGLQSDLEFNIERNDQTTFLVSILAGKGSACRSQPVSRSTVSRLKRGGGTCAMVRRYIANCLAVPFEPSHRNIFDNREVQVRSLCS